MTATTVLIWTGVVLIGGIGSVLRFLVDRTVTRRLARPFPFGTLAVNISGAALLGFLGGLALSLLGVLIDQPFPGVQGVLRLPAALPL